MTCQIETNKWSEPHAVTHNRIVCFIDLLGFKSCLEGRDQNQLRRVIELVRQLPRGDYAIGPTYDEGKYPNANTFHRARTTTFSDCYVFSFPFGELDTLRPETPTWSLDELAPTIATIFDFAVQIGCLIRGGIAIGQLWHVEGFLIGPGLSEAYELESSRAVNPRIILSEAAANHFGKHDLLYDDPDDGIRCFNFVKARHLQGDTEELKAILNTEHPRNDGSKAAKKGDWLRANWQHFVEA